MLVEHMLTTGDFIVFKVIWTSFVTLVSKWPETRMWFTRECNRIKFMTF